MTDSGLRSLTALLPLLALMAACGCSDLDNCPDEQPPRTIANKPGTTDVATLRFESAPAYGPLEHFPANSQLRFEHGLGVTPHSYQAFLSFTKEGTNQSDDGSITEIAGNEGTYQCIDDKVIVIKNDTCERSFYVRVVASGESLFETREDCL